MTSSLVGSEMCIRDSPSIGAWFSDSWMGKVSKLVQVLVTSPSEATLLAVAVSYTHLTLPTICSV
eukprot:12452158-Prorocentrum_lima.AAC.1